MSDGVSTLIGVLVIVAVVAFVIYRRSQRGNLSEQGRQLPGGGVACPHCGSTQFETKRAGSAKATAGCLGGLIFLPLLIIGPLLMPKSRVRCVVCGTEFYRR